jgi:hypothetical protein
VCRERRQRACARAAGSAGGRMDRDQHGRVAQQIGQIAAANHRRRQPLRSGTHRRPRSRHRRRRTQHRRRRPTATARKRYHSPTRYDACEKPVAGSQLTVSICRPSTCARIPCSIHEPNTGRPQLWRAAPVRPPTVPRPDKNAAPAGARESRPRGCLCAPPRAATVLPALFPAPTSTATYPHCQLGSAAPRTERRRRQEPRSPHCAQRNTATHKMSFSAMLFGKPKGGAGAPSAGGASAAQTASAQEKALASLTQLQAEAEKQGKRWVGVVHKNAAGASNLREAIPAPPHATPHCQPHPPPLLPRLALTPAQTSILGAACCPGAGQHPDQNEERGPTG